MREESVSSLSASIRLRSIDGSRKDSATLSRCFPIPRKTSFAVTMYATPVRVQKKRTSRGLRSF